jgi:hypothetical protein
MIGVRSNLKWGSIHSHPYSRVAIYLNYFLVCGVVLLFCLKHPFTQLPLAWFKGATSQDHPVAFALVMVGQE